MKRRPKARERFVVVRQVSIGGGRFFTACEYTEARAVPARALRRSGISVASLAAFYTEAPFDPSAAVRDFTATAKVPR